MINPGGNFVMTGPLTNASLAVQITTPDDDFIAIDEHQPSRKHELCCPHCESPGRRRTSREITITYREIHYICRNPACAHGWVASLNYEYGLSPSGIPDLTLNLPMPSQIGRAHV